MYPLYLLRIGTDGRFNYVIDTYLWSAASALAAMSTFPTTSIYVRELMNSRHAISIRSWIPSIRFSNVRILICGIKGANGRYEKLGTQWASALLGFLALVMAPIPMILFWYGPTLRAKSKYSPV